MCPSIQTWQNLRKFCKQGNPVVILAMKWCWVLNGANSSIPRPHISGHIWDAISAHNWPISGERRHRIALPCSLRLLLETGLRQKIIIQENNFCAWITWDKLPHHPSQDKQGPVSKNGNLDEKVMGDRKPFKAAPSLRPLFVRHVSNPRFVDVSHPDCVSSSTCAST